MNQRFFRLILIAAVWLAFVLPPTVAYADSATHNYDANGRLWQVIGPNWTTTYTYDNAGNVTNIARTTTQFNLLGVTSRKTHGSVGNFEIVLDRSVGVNGDVTVEPRQIGAGHTIVFRFNSPVTNPGIAIAYDKLGSQIGSATTTAAGNEVRVNLTGSLDTKRVRIDLSGVNGNSAVHQIAMGFLYGDVDNTRAVNIVDVSSIRARSGQVTNAANVTHDLNANGAIEIVDISIVRGQTGQVLE